MSGKMRPVENLSPWRRLAAAAYSAPREGKIYGTIEVDATEAEGFLGAKRREGIRLTMTHLVVRGAALALRHEVPELNRVIRRGRMYERPTVDIFVSVGINRGRDISGFKVTRADEKSLDEIAAEIREAAGRVRRGDQTIGLTRTKKVMERVPGPLLRPGLLLLRFLLMDVGLDLSRFGMPADPFGGLLVTDLSSYGLGIGFPALLPLSNAACIVAVGRAEQRAVVRNGEIVPRPILPLSATFDHRIADAYHAGALVRAARRYLEHPDLL